MKQGDPAGTKGPRWKCRDRVRRTEGKSESGLWDSGCGGGWRGGQKDETRKIE